MKKISNISNNISNFILATLMSFSLIYSASTSFNMIIDAFTLFSYSLIATSLFSIIFINKKSIRISIIFSGVASVISLIYFIASYSLPLTIYKISIFFEWLSGYLFSIQIRNLAYENIFIIILCLIISFVIYFFTFKKFNLLVILPLGTAVFILQWVMESFKSYNSLYLFIFVIIIYYFKYIYLKKAASENNSYISPAAFTAWTVPISALVLILALSAPTSNKPLEIKWLDNKVNAFFNLFSNTFSQSTSYEYFSLKNTGFGGSSFLGGKVHLDNTLVLKVEAPHAVYLKGASKDYYTGNQWINKDNPKKEFSEGSNSLIDDYTELMYSPLISNRNNENAYSIYSSNGSTVVVSDSSMDGSTILSGTYTSDDTNDLNSYTKYFYTDNVKVTYAGLHTKSIFIPVKTNSIEFNDNTQPLIDSEGILYTRKTSSKGFSYKLQVLTPKYNDPEFINLLRKSKVGLYVTDNYDLVFKSVVNTLKSSDDFDISNFIYKGTDGYRVNTVAYSDKISPQTLSYLQILYDKINNRYSKYLQLPATLPNRVKKLAESISRYETNNYDKVKAIEKYLSNNFLYTLDTKPTPSDRDFVDYFLFDQQEGYCTYFASAMVVMVRSLGIPARYVEGYMMPSKPKNNVYEITNENAHAWVEVYFEGIGWLPFEPTSPFTSSFYREPQKEVMYSESFSSSSYYKDYMKRLRGENGSDTETSPEDKTTVKTKNSNFDKYIIIGILIIILAFWSFVLVNIVRRRLRLMRILRMEPKYGVIKLYEQCLKMMLILNTPILPGETPLQYCKRVDLRMQFDSKYNFSVITSTFIKAKYSNHEVTAIDLSNCYHFYKFFCNRFNTEESKYIILYNKYILGKV